MTVALLTVDTPARGLALTAAIPAPTAPPNGNKLNPSARQSAASATNSDSIQPGAEQPAPPELCETDNNESKSAKRPSTERQQTSFQDLWNEIALPIEQNAEPQTQEQVATGAQQGGSGQLSLAEVCLSALAEQASSKNIDLLAQPQPAKLGEQTEPVVATADTAKAAESAQSVQSQPLTTAETILDAAASGAPTASSAPPERTQIPEMVLLAKTAGQEQAATSNSTPQLIETADAQEPPQAHLAEQETNVAQDQPAAATSNTAPLLSGKAPESNENTPSVQSNLEASGTQPLQEQARPRPEQVETDASAGQIPHQLQNTKTDNNLSTSPRAKDQDPTDIRPTAAQTNGRQASAKDSGPDTAYEQLLSGRNDADTFTSQPAKAQNTGSLTPNFDQPRISDQVIESIRASFARGDADNKITVRLNPPELGKLSIELRQHSNQLTGVLEVSKLQTRDQIQQALPQIITTLHEAGINLKKFDLVLSDQPQHQPFQDQSLQDGNARQHNDLNQSGNLETEPAERAQTQTPYQEVFEPQSFVTANTINMLI